MDLHISKLLCPKAHAYHLVQFQIVGPSCCVYPSYVLADEGWPTIDRACGSCLVRRCWCSVCS